MKNVIDHLQERGFIDALTSEELRERANSPLKVYIGFDPTADSLHIGNLVCIIALAWFQKFGHTPVVILGGATGRIGDPSGKSVERPMLDIKTLEENMARIRRHFDKILDFSKPETAPIILDNYEWYKPILFLDFLRDVGKHFRVGAMLAKEAVRSRLESEEGMSFTEFSYQLLQGYDYYHLFTQYGVCLEMGGSDQWGNITAGTELTRKLTGQSVYGATFPLLTRSDGKKFGKTEGGAVWLAEDRCSPYQFYQYFIRIPDADVINIMRMLTFIEIAEIRDIERKMGEAGYAPNSAQKRLAEEVTRIVHGDEGLQSALRVTEGAAPGSNASLDPEVLKEIATEMPHISLRQDEVIGQKFVDIASKIGLLASKGEAVRLISNGGAYLNNEKIEDPNFRFDKQHLIGGQYLLLGAGKKKKMLVTIIF